MTLGPDHYVPVLKVKRGEKSALRAISPTLRPRITPLLEIVEKTDSNVTVGQHIDKAFQDLSDSVQTYPRCFLDAREMVSDGPQAAAEVFNRAAAESIAFTPVTGVSRTEDVSAALSHQANGVALRLTRQEFENGLLRRAIPRFMSQYGLTAEETDLIIDLGPVDDFVSAGVIALTNAFLAAIPDSALWRTFSISASAFPSSMGVVQRNSYALVERAEWIAWRDNLNAREDEIPRLPTFSDCAIQHPRGVEGFDPRIMQMSAAIRYTSLDEWLLIKGESTRVTRPSVQFPDLATQLVYGYLSDRYMGSTHCEGCESIRSSADGAAGLGSAEVWRRLGAIHHITTVVLELEALSGP